MTVSEWRNLTISPACARASHLEASFRRVVFDESNFFEGIVKRHPAIARARPFAPLGCLADDKGNVPVKRSPFTVKHHPANGVNIHFPHAPRQHPREVSAPFVNFALRAPAVWHALAGADGWWFDRFHGAVVMGSL